MIKKRLSLLLLAFVLAFLLALTISVPTFAYDYSENEETMIASMISVFLKDKNADLSSYLTELRREDAKLADTYENIMDYWKLARTSLAVNRFNPDPRLYNVSQYTRVVDDELNVIPENLVADNSKLCIICLGFALQDNGDMKNELYGRLLTAYEVWKQYPGSYIAVTGGGTARWNSSVTEGGQMKKFLTEELGIPERYVICEDKAANTAGNAINTMTILSKSYPQVDSLFMVTSDYHIARGSTFFNTTAQLYKYKTGKEYTVVGNCGFATSTPYENNSSSYTSLYRQMYTICGIDENTPVVYPPFSDSVEMTDQSREIKATVRNSGQYILICVRYDEEGRMSFCKMQQVSLQKGVEGNFIDTSVPLRSGDKVMLLNSAYHPVTEACLVD